MSEPFGFEAFADEWFGSHLGIMAHSQDLGESSHFVLACGDITVHRSTWLQRFPSFLKESEPGMFSLPHTRDANGRWERHPWQPLAYAMLAGIDPNRTIHGCQTSLRMIAENSSHLGVVVPEDFGHLLIAAVLAGYTEDSVISISHRDFTLMELAEECYAAIDSSVSFCWGFHLLEAVCLSAFLLPLPRLQQPAENVSFARLQESVKLLTERKTMVEIGHALRNSIDLCGQPLQYLALAGHAVELAGIYLQLANVSTEKVREMVETISCCLAQVLDGVNSTDLCERHSWVGPFAHLKRGAVLLRNKSYFCSGSKIEEMHPAVSSPFRARAEAQELENLSKRFRHYSEPCSGNTESAVADIVIRSQLNKDLDWMVRREESFVAFRPSHWPVYLHYETQSNMRFSTAEVHLEFEINPILTMMFQNFGINLALKEQECTWDPYWAGGLGRVVFQADNSEVASNLESSIQKLLALSFDTLNTIVGSCISELDSWPVFSH